MRKTITTLVLSAGLVLGSAATASALPGPDNPHSTSSTWTDIHTGVAVYKCDKVLKKGKKGHGRNKYKYTNCRVQYIG